MNPQVKSHSKFPEVVNPKQIICAKTQELMQQLVNIEFYYLKGSLTSPRLYLNYRDCCDSAWCRQSIGFKLSEGQPVLLERPSKWGDHDLYCANLRSLIAAADAAGIADIDFVQDYEMKELRFYLDCCTFQESEYREQLPPQCSAQVRLHLERPGEIAPGRSMALAPVFYEVNYDDAEACLTIEAEPTRTISKHSYENHVAGLLEFLEVVPPQSKSAAAASPAT